MQNKLPGNIRNLRKERSLTQEQLAEAMTVTVGAVSKWELGQSMPELNLIMELADFFDVSVDALLGYELRSNSKEQTVARLIAYKHNKTNANSLSESEKALKKYPNCFDIVYYSADLYSLKGIETGDTGQLSRAIELFQHACLLIDQNTDSAISQISIQARIAEMEILQGKTEKALDRLKKNNIGGLNDALIGMTLPQSAKSRMKHWSIFPKHLATHPQH